MKDIRIFSAIYSHKANTFARNLRISCHKMLAALTHTHVFYAPILHLDLEDRESIDPGHEPGQGRLTSSTHTNQQQMTLEEKKKR